MITQNKRNGVTGTEDSDTSDPAGVGELATQVEIISLVNARLKFERTQTAYDDTTLLNRNCYSAPPLRLRGGGGDDDDVEMTVTAGTYGDMGSASGSQKRGPPSPGAHEAKQPRVYKQTGEINELLGWIEQTIIQEREKKKIGVQVAD